MGACNSPQVSTPSSKQLLISQGAKMLSNQILNNFAIGKDVSRMLNEVSFTRRQAIDLIKGIMNGIILLQEVQLGESREAIKALFKEKDISLIRNQKLFYYGILDKIKDSQISYGSKSRIYHTIANLKKYKIIQGDYQNNYGINCFKNNDYKELNEFELEQVVKYEIIADKTREIGQKIGFKFQSIKKQSQKMVNLLGYCMKKHIQAIGQLKYDLNQNQVMKMASISRQACNFYDNGVFILLVYFVQSCKRLQEQLKPPKYIENLLKQAINNISILYPPGFGLSSEHQELIKTLKDLQNPKHYNKIDFNHPQLTITHINTKKQEQVEQIITKYAILAEESKESFEELVKTTCLSKCVYFKIGLKYYPKHPNIKALTRIKEKMFFKKESNEQKIMSGRNIKQILEKQQSEYREKIDKMLENTSTVQFKITDMLRGKCVFLDVADIIYSVNQIKKLVAKNPKFGIAQIESRFTNKIPISDVTLKIVVNNKIVAELQLTIQTNAAAYYFAHKIYELQRTKVFSKLKIVHNYFQESKEEFNELAKNALNLQTTKTLIPDIIIQNISSYFKLSSNSQSFKEILQDVVQQNSMIINKLAVSVDPLLQNLISVAFNIAIGKWGKEIGQIINKSLKNQKLSPKIKSVILSIFVDKFNLVAQSQTMKQYGYQKRYLQENIYMQEFMRQYFQIEQIYKYINQNQRLYHRAQQLQQIVFQKQVQSFPIELKDAGFVDNIVIQYRCFQKIQNIQELFNFYFITRRQNNSIYCPFSRYSQWLQSQIKSIKHTEAQRVINQIQIIKAQYQIQQNNPKQAQKYLQYSLQYFKVKQDHQKVMECQILLIECRIKTNDWSLKQCNDNYSKVIQKASILGLQLKGVLYADSLWRIQQYLWQKFKEKKEILEHFTARALVQMSKSKGKQFIDALIMKYPEYDANQIQPPQIKPNEHIKYAKITNIKPKQCQYLVKADWKNLIKLDLSYEKINTMGCQQLTKANWRNLTTLNLTYCHIGDEGCEQIIKADWKNLTTLCLSGNDIQVGGCSHLTKADWKNIVDLDLSDNYIRDAGCKQLIKADWKNLINLSLYYNRIKALGCHYLIDSNWKNLTKLILQKNDIGALGCQHLSKADWNNLKTLDLTYNSIGDLGCEHLAKANWKKMTKLHLNNNKIGVLGCQHLSKADWKHLSIINLYGNDAEAPGFEQIIKGNWKNLTSLNLTYNYIGDVGCSHFNKADWKNITSLVLYDNKISAAGCEQLVKANWKNITILNLSSNKIGSAGCQQLIKSDWKNITILDLKGNNIGPNGCQQLVKADWKNITQLNLDGNNIGVLGCQQLIKSNWKKLSILYLSNNNIGAMGCQKLTKANWKNLSILYLQKNNIGVMGCQKLIKGCWKNMAELNLCGNNIEAAGCEQLAKAGWQNITKLDLSENNVGLAGCELLNKANWKNLRQLNISKNKLQDDEQFIKTLFQQGIYIKI